MTTMLSFRVDDEDARAVSRFAEARGVERSALLREALRRHLGLLAAEADAARYDEVPLTEDELLVAGAADGVRPRTGRTGPTPPTEARTARGAAQMRRGEIWFATTPGGGGDRPVLVLTRDPVADRIGSVVVAALTRTVRGLSSELDLDPAVDGVPSACVASFDNLHTLSKDAFRRRVTRLEDVRMQEALPGAGPLGRVLTAPADPWSPAPGRREVRQGREAVEVSAGRGDARPDQLHGPEHEDGQAERQRDGHHPDQQHDEAAGTVE